MTKVVKVNGFNGDASVIDIDKIVRIIITDTNKFQIKTCDGNSINANESVTNFMYKIGWNIV